MLDYFSIESTINQIEQVYAQVLAIDTVLDSSTASIHDLNQRFRPQLYHL